MYKNVLNELYALMKIGTRKIFEFNLHIPSEAEWTPHYPV